MSWLHRKPSKRTEVATERLDRELRRLHRERPRRRTARWTAVALLVLAALSWFSGDFHLADLYGPSRQDNVSRFLGELRPYPLQGKAWDWGVAAGWARQILSERGLEATAATAAISIVAIVLAALAGLVLCLPAARSFATAEPYLPAPRPPSWPRRLVWRGFVTTVRAALILLRSLPEYVWAFILIALIGPSAWPAILALAIHNAGILGKLNAEVVENLEPPALRALRGLGASRHQIAAAGIIPAILPRFLLFFFYRWESCVREATVLGMLGIISLGYWIRDARARMHYDEMFFLVLLGAAIVIVGDLISVGARELIRRAS